MNRTSNCNRPGPGSRIRTWLWNPFTTTAGFTSLVAGILVILLASALGSLSNTHFDGVLDVHTGRPVPLWFFLSQGIVNWLCLAIVLWIVALVIVPRGRKFRAVDLFGTQALARWPFLAVALVCLLPGYGRFTDAMIKALPGLQSGQFQMPEVGGADTISFAAVLLVMLLAVIWFVAMSWKAFRVSCDVGGWKAIVGFIAGILVAEVLSKVAIWGMLPLL